MATEHEVYKDEQELSSELEKSQETLETFTTTLAELEQKLNAFKTKISQPSFLDEINDFLREITIMTLNYQIHFLNPLERLLRSLDRHISKVLSMILMEESQILHDFRIKDIPFFKKMIEKFRQETEVFTEICTKAFIMEKPTQQELIARLESTIKTLVPIAKKWHNTDIPKHLSAMREVIDKAKSLVQPITGS